MACSIGHGLATLENRDSNLRKGPSRLGLVTAFNFTFEPIRVGSPLQVAAMCWEAEIQFEPDAKLSENRAASAPLSGGVCPPPAN